MSAVHRLLGCSLILYVALAAGCGGDEFGRTMGAVKGKVTIKGTPVAATAPNKMILVFEKRGERPESVDVGPDGNFSGNAPLGSNQVRLQLYGDFPGVKKDFTQEVTVESGKEYNFEVGE